MRAAEGEARCSYKSTHCSREEGEDRRGSYRQISVVSRGCLHLVVLWPQSVLGRTRPIVSRPAAEKKPRERSYKPRGLQCSRLKSRLGSTANGCDAERLLAPWQGTL